MARAVLLDTLEKVKYCSQFHFISCLTGLCWLLVALLVNFISINAATQDKLRKPLKLSKYLSSAFNRSRYLVIRLKSLDGTKTY